jgi:MFS family permease
MRKRLLGLAMAVATFGLAAQGGTANAFLLQDRSPNVTAGQIIAGGGMAAAYFALICKHGHCLKFTNSTALKWYGLTTIGCFALSPIIGGALVSYNEHRELRSSEVFMMVADCVVPIVGGWVAKAAFDANPHWDDGTGLSKR